MHSSADVRRYYDACPDYNDFCHQDGWSVPQEVVSRSIALLRSARSILDVGCGTGLIGRELRAQQWRGRLVGVDIAKNRLAEARRLGCYDRLLVGNAYQLPDPQGSYDAVIASAVLGLAGPKALFQMIRQTKPDGLIIAAVGLLKSSRELRQRYARVVRAIHTDSQISIVSQADLGHGYTEGRTDEHYRLWILRKNT